MSVAASFAKSLLVWNYAAGSRESHDFWTVLPDQKWAASGECSAHREAALKVVIISAPTAAAVTLATDALEGAR